MASHRASKHRRETRLKTNRRQAPTDYPPLPRPAIRFTQRKISHRRYNTNGLRRGNGRPKRNQSLSPRQGHRVGLQQRKVPRSDRRVPESRSLKIPPSFSPRFPQPWDLPGLVGWPHTRICQAGPWRPTRKPPQPSYLAHLHQQNRKTSAGTYHRLYPLQPPPHSLRPHIQRSPPTLTVLRRRYQHPNHHYP